MKGNLMWIVYSLSFLFSSHSVATAANTDTLIFNEYAIDYHFEQVHAILGEELDPDLFSRSELKVHEMPVVAKSDVLVHKYISYQGKTPIDVIIETGGFHYVDVIAKNLTQNTAEIKKTGRSRGYGEKEFFTQETLINKVKLRFEPGTMYELTLFYPNPKNEKIKIDIYLSDINSWQNKLETRLNASSFWLGIFFGTLVLLSLVNFIFYYLFKDRTYMVYVGYIVFIFLYEVTIFGYLDNNLLKYAPAGVPIISNTALILSAIFYLLFLRNFLNLKSRYPRWNKIVKYFLLFLTLLFVISNILVLSGRPISGFNIRNLGLLLVIPAAIVFLINVGLSRRLVDRIFFSGSIFLIAFGLLSIITYFYGNSQASDFYLQGGILVELVIFNIGLGLRSKIIQHEKDQELHSMILKLKESEENQKHLNANLELKVEERTQKINEINRELTVQRDQLFQQKETIEQNLEELNDIRNNLVQKVDQKTIELRQANKELVAQNAQLEQYAYITAHNLKAPVARLKGLVNIFELTNDETNPATDLIQRIKEASIDMDEVINDINKILQIKNFSEQDRTTINLQHLVDKIVKRLEKQITENNITVKTNLKLASIESIDTYLESILYNLVYNGIKYCRNGVDAQILISSYRRNNKNIIEVTDNGVGIDLDKYQEKLFGLYQRFHNHVNGKGIGLYLVKTQVEALNGRISVESKVMEGSKFSISFLN